MEFCDSSVTGGRIGGANEMKRDCAERVREVEKEAKKGRESICLIERAAVPKWLKG